jgi:eukaryotic-like serine/threonine-protein kinase
VADLLAQLQTALAGRYTVERELGRGGMAAVYLARDLRNRRRVALKVLHPELGHALGGDRFLREIEVAANLTHPHILPLFDSGEVEGLLFYVMPYVEGESLRDRLRRAVQLSVDESVRIAGDVAAALAYAHGQGIIHRDIKPENILIEGDEAVVADFGIAKAVSAAGGAHLTETGMAVGTAAYMSPEQAAGERHLDGRTDVYSLGCVLYEMLAGETPYTGPSAQSIAAKRLLDPLPSVRRLRPSVPEWLDAVVTRALAPISADRFATAAELARALRPDSTGTARPIASHPAPVRRRFLVAGLALVVCVVVSLGVLFAWRRASSGGEGGAGAKRLAVLPFENLGNSANAYFAEGMSDAVRGKLIALGGLEVIARASSMTFRQADKAPEEVARELGVRYLLSGTVRWASGGTGPDRVQVSPELVEVRRAGPPASKWQQPFDAALTDVFQVQAEIAGRVAGALDVVLGTQERQELIRRPTADLAAYDAFLQGEAAAHALAAEDLPSFRRAATLYEKAVTRDSTFGIAWARLAEAHALLYSYGSHSAEDAEACRQALARAERLAPKAPEMDRARTAYLELVRLDFAGALRAAETGLTRTPGSSELMAYAAIEEWRLGRIGAAVARLTRAQTIDPRSVIVLNYLGAALLHQRRWSEAHRAFDQALSLAPTNLGPLTYKVAAFLGEGDLAGARRTLAQLPPGMDRAEVATNIAGEEIYWALDPASQDLVIGLPPSAFDDNRALWALILARLLHLRSDTAKSRAYADTARIEYARLLGTNPDDQVLRSHLGLALAYLGRKAEAMKEGERGVELLPVERDGIWGPRAQLQLARIYVLVGEPEKAFDQLERLLKVPYYFSIDWLRIDPNFRPLHDTQRFRRLLESAG